MGPIGTVAHDVFAHDCSSFAFVFYLFFDSVVAQCFFPNGNNSKLVEYDCMSHTQRYRNKPLIANKLIFRRFPGQNFPRPWTPFDSVAFSLSKPQLENQRKILSNEIFI